MTLFAYLNIHYSLCSHIKFPPSETHFFLKLSLHYSLCLYVYTCGISFYRELVSLSAVSTPSLLPSLYTRNKITSYQILALLFKSTTLIPHLFHIYHEEYEYLGCYRLKTWMEFGKKEVSGVNCALKNYRIHSEFNILGQAFRSDR